jgi:hypothetical protein
MIDPMTSPTVCLDCGASAFPGHTKCWLCGLDVDANPYQASPAPDEVPEPPFTPMRAIDNAVSFVLVAIVVLNAIGIAIAEQNGLGLMIYALTMLPGVFMVTYVRKRQRLDQSKGFRGSKTFALIAGGVSILAVNALLLVALGILLFALCFAGI